MLFVTLFTSLFLLLFLKNRKAYRTPASKSAQDETTHTPTVALLPVTTTMENRYLLNISNINKKQRITYVNKEIVPPFMVDGRDEKLFYASNVNRVIIDKSRLRTNSAVTGNVMVYSNITIYSNFSCWNYINKKDPVQRTPQWHRMGSSPKFIHVYSASPIAVNSKDSLYTFLSEILPRIAQIYDILRKLTDTPLLLKRTRDPVVLEMISSLQLPYTFYDKIPVLLQYSLDTCETPINSTVLWQKGRHLLGLDNVRRALPQFGKIIVIASDPRCRLASRILNLKDILTFLRERYSDTSVAVEYIGSSDFNTLKERFRHARLVIGVLSEDLYALYFCPPGTHVLEVLPFHPGGAVVAGPLAHVQPRFWLMSNMLQLLHWRLYEPAHSASGDVTIPLTRLRNVLDKIDQLHRNNNKEF